MNTPRSATATAPVRLTGLLDLGLRRIAGRAARHFSSGVPAPIACRVTGSGLDIPSLQSGDVQRAGDFYKGRFQFGNTAIECSGRVIFDHIVPDEVWTAKLHGFAWLNDLESGNRELFRVQARALVNDWIGRGKSLDSRTWQTATLARRVVSWTRHSAFLLQAAPHDFEKTFLTSLTRQIRRLLRTAARESDRRARLDAATALNYASLGLAGTEGLRSIAFARLERELEAQILPDGGHVSRNPAVLLEVLNDLLPLRHAMEFALLEVPEGLNSALERMLPMLRFFTHQDFGLAVFNGVADTAPLATHATFESDAVAGSPLVHALHSGYCRLAHGPARVIMDTGKPPAPGFNPAATSGPLAFEFSDGPHRIVINCGSPQADQTEWKDVARTTAAHSTVTIDNRSAGTIFAGRLMHYIFGTPVIMGPSIASGQVTSSQQGSVLKAEHDGYLNRYGLIHHRHLFLSQDGSDLRGEDRFGIDLDHSGDISTVPFTARFHIHPDVRATLSQDSSSVMLMLPDKSGWRFSAKGGRLRLEDSIYMPGAEGTRRCKQIVLEGIVGRPDRINWAFKRIEKRKAASPARPTAAPELPL